MMLDSDVLSLKDNFPKSIKETACWHSEMHLTLFIKKNTKLYFLSFFTSPTNVGAVNRKDLLRRSKTAALISILIIYWNMGGDQLASEAQLPVSRTSRREAAFWWDAPSGGHDVNAHKLLGLKQTPEPAHESDENLSDGPRAKVLRSQRRTCAAWHATVPYGSPSQPQDPWSWTKIVGSTDTNGVWGLDWVYGVITRQSWWSGQGKSS